MKASPVPNALRTRELEILRLVADGLTNAEIADQLVLSVGTVRWHLKEIYSKLHVHDRSQVIVRAQEMHLLAGPGATMTGVTVRHNLPRSVTPFVGRQADLAELVRLLAEPRSSLVTILAPGGMGKTRLALAVAEQQLSRFPDGIFFVPLAQLGSADDLVTAIADNAGFTLFSDQPRLALLNYFRHRVALLVLDNFEHLLDGGLLLTELLRAAPGVRLLVTSREKLHLSGETVFALGGLSFPVEIPPTLNLSDYDAVELFLQSARAVRPALELRPENLRDVARICRLTAGMPLAIILAATWVDVLSLGHIAAEIERGLDILATEWRDMPERQQSVRATLLTSWQRLTAVEQETFMKLSVFRGGFTIESASVVAAASLSVLRGLVNKALIQVDTAGRYGIHELLRQYGAEHLAAAGCTDETRAAHSAYHLTYLAARDEDVKGRRQEESLREIRVDFENIRQAWLWAVEQGQFGQIDAALDCLYNATYLDSMQVDGQALLQAAVAAIQPLPGDDLRRFRDRLVLMLIMVNSDREVVVDFEEVQRILDRAQARGGLREAALCLRILRIQAFNQHDFAAYLGFGERSLALWRQTGDEYEIAVEVAYLEGAYTAFQQVERGLVHLRECVAIRRRIGDRRNLPLVLHTLGGRLVCFGRFAEAEAAVDEALAIQDEIGKIPSYSGVCAFWALPRFLRGDFEAARQKAEDGRRFAADHPWINGATSTGTILSYVASASGDYRRARELCQHDPNRPMSPMVNILNEWGVALAECGLGNDAAARRSLCRTLELTVDKLPSPTYQILCLPLAAILAARAGEDEHAAELLGLTSTAPPEMIGWMAKWPLLRDIRRDLENTLGVGTYVDVFERGKRQELSAVIAALRTEYEAAVS